MAWGIAAMVLLGAAGTESWPALPDTNGSALIPVQEWPYQPGPRTARAYIRYPNKQRTAITADTGLMLSLHNWGGTDHLNAPDPQTLADRYNLVVISVDYVQSGKYDPQTQPPYDHGLYQALDALRALYWVWNELRAANTPLADDRIYTTGGSGGGNVSLMANKLAPRTFALVVDISGMAKLNDDIAYGLHGGSLLNAGYSRDPESERYLSPDAQAIRDNGHAQHLTRMRALGNSAKVVVVHGAEDTACPTADVHAMLEAYKTAGIDHDAHIIDTARIDGDPYKNTGHSIGDRTRILIDVADTYLDPHAPTCARRKGPTDFERKDDVVQYPGQDGTYIVSYTDGHPTLTYQTN
jgi:hypothetical protein